MVWIKFASLKNGFIKKRIVPNVNDRFCGSDWRLNCPKAIMFCTRNKDMIDSTRRIWFINQLLRFLVDQFKTLKYFIEFFVRWIVLKSLLNWYFSLITKSDLDLYLTLISPLLMSAELKGQPYSKISKILCMQILTRCYWRWR